MPDEIHNTTDLAELVDAVMEAAPKGPMEEVGLLPNGCMLFREANGVGGFTYWSDEVGGGVFVWDTCLVSQDTLLAALTEEARRAYKERVDARS